MSTAPTARDLLSRPRIDVVAGAGSPLEARLVEAAGFEAVYVSGYAMAAAMHGRPDIGILDAAENVAGVLAIRAVTDLPLLVDADTGYGDVVNVRDTVRRLEQAGANAIQLEDQVWPKRCGHMAGKRVVDVEEMLRKIDAAVNGRRDPATAIVARTDSRAPLGLAEALRRVERFRAAGADAVFVDAPQSADELRAVGALAGGGPLVVNMSETGLTPMLPAAELEAMGFSVAIYPTAALRVGAYATLELLRGLRRTGDTRSGAPAMMSLDQLNELVGLGELTAFEDTVAARTATR
ncbi:MULTISPECIES: isocitrate lyase/PEP mutase family protein [Micromonospora]|uniref:2,3-dimethylmalate lyase n=1 Tax=Micromonospora yangpuensis TaxID=683228 RepID=A0A1C6UVW5_9ACTN|nr:oxaloacetate decarboxylase [Micromonospora yangpuensis]GGM25759.1 carboxyvinyl-carboxyphosphonate phosphorylmutase [Micromonospora yangpuensis]SCL58160.1 2,3-dimethylmalate lyase [Micromonospora yangpuensis]